MKRNTDLRFELPRSKVSSPGGVLALLQGQVQTSGNALPDEKTVAMWQREAAEGSPNAQYELAKMLTSGEPVSADNRAAVKWLKKAAEKQHAESQHMLGVLIARGQGVRADPAKAAALFRAAAIMGNANAQYDLGRALDWGFGCEENPLSLIHI